MKFCRSCGSALIVPTVPGAGAYQPPAPQMAAPIGTMNGPGSGAVAMPAGMPAPGPFVTPIPIARSPQAPASTMGCPRCGTPTPIGYAYCQQCGLHMQPVQPTDPAQSRLRAGAIDAGGGLPTQPPQVDGFGATIAQPDTGQRVSAAALAVANVARPEPTSPMASPGGIGTPSGARTAPVVAPTPAWGSAVLVNRDGSDGQRFPLSSDDTVIGRVGADIAFDDDRFLARQHARLERAADGGVRIHPLDALNGVFKKTDAPVELADGTTILVGREVLRFERVSADERAVHPLVRHGVSLFGSPPREPWGRLMQLVPSGGYRDVRHLFTDEVVLGREEGDVVFRDDAFMSRRHAALTWDGKRALITDLGSSNGSFVRIAGPMPLKHGDHVRMGDQLLRIELR